MNNPKISLILPFYKQGDHIDTVIKKYISVLHSLPFTYEMIPVVNGSNDDSFSICQSIASKHNFIYPLESKKAGWGLDCMVNNLNKK